MGGQDGNRGYLLQAIIAVLQSLTQTNWVRIAIEPDENNQKVDIQQWDSDGKETVQQVKSSVNNFDKSEILKILNELVADAPDAEIFILTLIGTYSGDTVKFFNHFKDQDKSEFGKYQVLENYKAKIKIELKALDIPALDGQIESKIHAFLSTHDYVVPHTVIHFISLGLTAQFSRFATDGRKVERTDLQQQLINWMRFNYPKELRRETEQLALYFYGETQFRQSIAITPTPSLPDITQTEYFLRKQHELLDLIEQIDAIKLPATLPETDEGIEINRWSIFGPYGRLSALFEDDEISVMKQRTKQFLNIALPDDFFQVGQVRKLEMTSATLFLGSGPKFSGTEDEKKKRELLGDFQYHLNVLNDLSECWIQLNEYQALPIVMMNEGNDLQTNLEVQLDLPQDVVILTENTFPKLAYNTNMELFSHDAGFSKDLFILEENSKVKAYDYRNIVPMHYPILSPFGGKPRSEYERLLKQSLEWIFDYKIYNDIPSIKTLTCQFKNLKPKNAMMLPSYLFIKFSKPFEIAYKIKSDQSGNSEGKLIVSCIEREIN